MAFDGLGSTKDLYCVSSIVKRSEKSHSVLCLKYFKGERVWAACVLGPPCIEGPAGAGVGYAAGFICERENARELFCCWDVGI